MPKSEAFTGPSKVCVGFTLTVTGTSPRRSIKYSHVQVDRAVQFSATPLMMAGLFRTACLRNCAAVGLCNLSQPHTQNHSPISIACARFEGLYVLNH
eukprot:915522-Amphidinium_carterae.1